MQKNQVGGKRKNKEKVIDAKPKNCSPHVPPSDGEASEMIFFL